MKTLFINLLVMISIQASAFEIGSDFPVVKLSNQFEEPTTVSPSTKKVFFTEDKKAAAVMTEFLTENPKKLDEAQAVFVSDISKMPSMISKMFARPAMKKYLFKIALDHEGDHTGTWPREKEKLTVIELDNQKVTNIRYLQTKEDVANEFKAELTK